MTGPKPAQLKISGVMVGQQVAHNLELKDGLIEIAHTGQELRVIVMDPVVAGAAEWRLHRVAGRQRRRRLQAAGAGGNLSTKTPHPIRLVGLRDKRRIRRSPMDLQQLAAGFNP